MLLILTLLFGFIVFCIFFKKHAGYSKMLAVSFVFLFASGIFLLFFKKCLFDTQLFDIATGILLTGTFLLLTFLFLIQTVFVCSHPVQATYTGFNTYTSRGSSSCAPRYQYEYNGCFYEEQSPRSEPARFLKCLTPGRQYTIYINPRNPRQCCAARRFHFTDALIFLCAVSLLACGIALLANRKELLPFITY